MALSLLGKAILIWCRFSCLLIAEQYSERKSVRRKNRCHKKPMPGQKTVLLFVKRLSCEANT